MGDYKDKNGTTRVGDFLRDIDLSKSLEVVGNLVKGNIDGAISVITNADNISPEEREHALKVMQLDIEEMKSVSKRWEADLQSDSTLAKNVSKPKKEIDDKVISLKITATELQNMKDKAGRLVPLGAYIKDYIRTQTDLFTKPTSDE